MPFSYATVNDYLASPEAGGQDALDLSNLDSPSAGSADSGQIQEALEQGAGEMETILATRYPIATLRAMAPSLQALVDINIAMGRYFLDVRYGARDDTRKRYEDCLARLRRIAKGDEELIDGDGVPIAITEAAQTGGGRVGQGSSLFTRSSLSGLMGY